MSETVAGTIKARDARNPAARFISDAFISRVAVTILRRARRVLMWGLDGPCSFIPDSGFSFIYKPSLRKSTSLHSNKPHLTALLLRPESPYGRGALDLAIETAFIQVARLDCTGRRISSYWWQECRQWQHNVAFSGSIPLQPAITLLRGFSFSRGSRLRRVRHLLPGRSRDHPLLRWGCRLHRRRLLSGSRLLRR
jgi:hypothetical protein